MIARTAKMRTNPTIQGRWANMGRSSAWGSCSEWFELGIIGPKLRHDSTSWQEQSLEEDQETMVVTFPSHFLRLQIMLR